MKVKVHHKLLIDSPFNGDSSSSIFSFDSQIVQDLVHDVLHGQPTSYLISGYRGAGKSSFVKKVESVIDERLKNASPDEDHMIFVNTSFAKYSDQTYLLRKLIRGLFYALNSEKNRKAYESLKKKDDEEKDIDKKVIYKIETLFERTFNEVQEMSKVKNVTRNTFKVTWSINKIIRFFLKMLSPVILLVFWSLNIKYRWFDLPSFLDLFIMLGSFGGTVFTFFKATSTFVKSSEVADEFNRKSLYDNEIADFHFYKVLDLLHSKKYKVLFVLDELDKVEAEDVDRLINEMKPYLVSGFASFIVVAGQQLYYKYNSSLLKDDAVLSTLFSRVIHIRLASASELVNIFQTITKQDVKDGEKLVDQIKPYIDYLIFKSKRVPRRFMNLIRQNLIWDTSSENAFLEIPEELKQFSVHSNMLDAIASIEDKELAGNFEDAMRDRIVMELFLNAERMFYRSKGNGSFTVNDI